MSEKIMDNIPAGVASKKEGYKTFIMGVPFEVIKNSDERNALMNRVMTFFENK